MRNDYLGYGLLKDRAKYLNEVLEFLIRDNMGIEEKTLIRVQVHMMSYRELVDELKRVRALKNQS